MSGGNLAEALASITGLPMPGPLADAIHDDRSHAPAQVTAAAENGDALCVQVLQLFCKLYGAEAGNLALKTHTLFPLTADAQPHRLICRRRAHRPTIARPVVFHEWRARAGRT